MVRKRGGRGEGRDRDKISVVCLTFPLVEIKTFSYVPRFIVKKKRFNVILPEEKAKGLV